jgi:hypothetical protein
MVCVITRRFGAHRKGFDRCSLASIRTWLYRPNMRRLTHPAIAMIVESDVPFSSS